MPLSRHGNSARTQRGATRAPSLRPRIIPSMVEPLESRRLLSVAPLGVNIEAVADYGRSFMFADAMKSARRFGNVGTPWDETAPVDVNGWPTTDAAVTILVLDNTGQTPIRIDGTYKFSATGRIFLSPVACYASIANWSFDPLTNKTTADVIVHPGANALHLNMTGDPNGAKDVHLWRPGTVQGQTFTTEFLQSLEGVQTLRMMDFTRTNTNQSVEWADRALVTDATQASSHKGAAWEYTIELANMLDKDLWINVPISASDDYVVQMAELFRNTLEPERRIYVEYANEVWNFGFQQFGINYDLAQADVALDPSDLNWDGANNTYQYAWRRVAKRLVEIRDIFANVWGESAINDMIRPVLASQVGWSFVLKDQLDYLEHRFGGDLSGQIYAVAGAPYMSIGETLSHSATLTVDEIMGALNADLAAMQTGIQKYEAMAVNHRLKLLYYEGGIDLQGNSWGNFYNAKLPANYDERMYDLVRSYLRNAFENGADGVMYYSQISAYTHWGTWGLTDSVQDLQSAKLRGFRSVANEAAPAPSSGIALPATYGGIMVDAGSYLLDTWANQGRGGIVEGAGRGGNFTYLLNAAQEGEYTIQLAAGTLYSDGRVEVLIDGVSAGIIELPTTPHMQVFRNSAALNLGFLEAGHHTLKLRIVSGYMNLQGMTLGTQGYEAPPPVQPLIPAPPAPQNFTAVALDTTRILLNWSDVKDEWSYQIERSTDGVNWIQVALLNADILTYTDSGLTQGVRYSYRLRAGNHGGDSPFTPVVSASTRLLAPGNLTIVNTSPTAVELQWSPVENAAAYLIQRSSSNGRVWTDLTRVSRRATTYTDFGVSANTSYSYRIFAISLDGTLSEMSTVATVRTKKK